MLNEKHAQKIARLNAKGKEKNALEIGAKVWYIRPEGSGTKIDSRWLGPAEIFESEGEHSYVLQTRPNTTIIAHRDSIKPYNLDTHVQENVPMFRHRRTVIVPEEEETQLRVQRVIKHEFGGHEGKLKFLAQKG